MGVGIGVVIGEIDKWRRIKTKGRYLGTGIGGEINALHLKEIPLVFLGDVRHGHHHKVIAINAARRVVVIAKTQSHLLGVPI